MPTLPRFSISNRRIQSTAAQTAINQCTYAHPNPSKPVIGISLDGCDVRHLSQSVNHYMPHVYNMITSISHTETANGYMCPISTVFPTCCRPNQVSIVTGTTPNDHGIVGDYCIDSDITDSDSLFADSILTELSHENVNVLFMSLNEEYREQLTYDFHPNSTSLSLQSLIEYAFMNMDHALKGNALVDMLLNDNAIFSRLKDLSIYFETKNAILTDTKGECGLFLLEIMKTVLQSTTIDTPHLSYIALSPATIHHYHDHRSPQMMHYLSDIDGYLNVFHAHQCRYGVTSAHGTNYKLGANGDLFIMNIERKLNECWDLYGKELDLDLFALFEYKIILQKKLGTAPVDVLCGFAHIHMMEKVQGVDKELKNRLVLRSLGYMRNLKGVYSSIGHEEACGSLELPPERIGDMVLLGDMDTIFCDDNVGSNGGGYPWRLSHGALDESTVPLILNERPTQSYLTMLSKGKARNYHLFDILLNGYEETLQDRCPYKHSPTQYPYVGK